MAFIHWKRCVSVSSSFWSSFLSVYILFLHNILFSAIKNVNFTIDITKKKRIFCEWVQRKFFNELCLFENNEIRNSYFIIISCIKSRWFDIFALLGICDMIQGVWSDLNSLQPRYFKIYFIFVTLFYKYCELRMLPSDKKVCHVNEETRPQKLIVNHKMTVTFWVRIMWMLSNRFGSMHDRKVKLKQFSDIHHWF